MGRPSPASPSFAATERTKSPGRDVWGILVIGGTETKTGGVSAMLVTATTNSSVATLRESTVPSVQAFWRKENIPAGQRWKHLANELKHIRGNFFIVERSLQVDGAPGGRLMMRELEWSLPCLAVLRCEVFPHLKIQRCRWRWSHLEIRCQLSSLTSVFEFDLSYKAGDPSVHFWVVGEDEVSNPESRVCIFSHLDHPWPSEERSLRFGHIDGSVHDCRFPAGVLQDQTQTVHGALCCCIYTSFLDMNKPERGELKAQHRQSRWISSIPDSRSWQRDFQSFPPRLSLCLSRRRA